MLLGRAFLLLGIHRICKNGQGLSQQGSYPSRGIHVFVDIAYVLLQMLPDKGKLGSVDANHPKFINLARLREATNVGVWIN